MGKGNFNIIRHESHTGVTGTFTAACEVGYAVKVSGVKSFAPAAGGDTVVGTSHHKVAIGEVGTVRIKGDIVPMTAGAAIAAGARVKIGATAGQVIAWVDGTDDKDLIVGVAWTAAAAANDDINIIVL